MVVFFFKAINPSMQLGQEQQQSCSWPMREDVPSRGNRGHPKALPARLLLGSFSIYALAACSSGLTKQLLCLQGAPGWGQAGKDPCLKPQSGSASPCWPC